MNGLYIAAFGAFIVCVFLLIAADLEIQQMGTPERDDRDLRERIEQQKEDDHYREIDKPYDREDDEE